MKQQQLQSNEKLINDESKMLYFIKKYSKKDYAYLKQFNRDNQEDMRRLLQLVYNTGYSDSDCDIIKSNVNFINDSAFEISLSQINQVDNKDPLNYESFTKKQFEYYSKIQEAKEILEELVSGVIDGITDKKIKIELKEIYKYLDDTKCGQLERLMWYLDNYYFNKNQQINKEKEVY